MDSNRKMKIFKTIQINIEPEEKTLRVFDDKIYRNPGVEPLQKFDIRVEVAGSVKAGTQ